MKIEALRLGPRGGIKYFLSMESLKEKIARLIAEKIELAPYDPAWPDLFQEEKKRLQALLPPESVRRIEHFGSTAVPGLAAKPIIDMLVETEDMNVTREVVPPILEPLGYDYVWRPSFGDDIPPWYAWFIRRDAEGRRTHHIHFVEPDFEHWNRLAFRDFLIARPDLARAYEELKYRLADLHPGDRVAYTDAKTAFITETTREALKSRQVRS